MRILAWIFGIVSALCGWWWFCRIDFTRLDNVLLLCVVMFAGAAYLFHLEAKRNR